ncbi:hypothetical protein [Sporichthya polymorpha]|uniref:hypothetical protein n=1 Tax=Sporichthya polymorpha TaxID=35751 RepID=UPI000380CD85|nr:hypothetical protein [Sporichthya polymorpha]
MSAAGYTVVVCQSDGCRSGLGLMPALRALVRATPHAVLVSSGCTVGTLTCRSRVPGPVVLVQPCDEQRRPVGPAVHVGPLRTRSDVADLIAWLRTGDLDPADLPWWLRLNVGLDAARRAALHN